MAGMDTANIIKLISGRSAAAIAEASGVSTKTIYRIRSEGYLPSLRTLDKIHTGLRKLGGQGLGHADTSDAIGAPEVK